MDKRLTVMIYGVGLVGDILTACKTFGLVKQMQETLILFVDGDIGQVGHLARVFRRRHTTLA